MRRNYFMSLPSIMCSLAMLTVHANAYALSDEEKPIGFKEKIKKTGIELMRAGIEDFRSQSVSRRWAVIMVGVLGEGDSAALAAALHAALVIKTTFAWRGDRWKFAVFNDSLAVTPNAVQELSAAVNAAKNVTVKLMEEVASFGLTPESLVCQVIAVPMQGAEPMWIFVGVRNSASSKATPIFRVQSGNVETAANVLRELLVASQQRG